MITGDRIYTHSTVEAERGVCAAGSPQAAEAGVRIMKAGGNAIDGITAAAFTAFVTEQAYCGLGGYAHISVWMADYGKFVSFDAYGRAPLAATPDMFEPNLDGLETYYEHPFTKGDKARHGALAPAVPGAVAGFFEAHSRFGRLPFAKVLEPAIAAAENGVPFTWFDSQSIAAMIDPIKAIPGSADALLPGGKPPASDFNDPVGIMRDTRALARTLKTIAAKGRAGFTRGRVAKAIAAYVQSIGGILTTEDLAKYKVRVLHETPSRYRGHDYVACYDQVAYEALNILDHYDLRAHGADSYEYRHLVAEALALAFSDSIIHYGDPDFVASPVEGLTNPAFAAARRKLIRLRKAMDRPVPAGDPWAFDPGSPGPDGAATQPSKAKRPGTTQVAIADRFGNMASVCMSLGSGYGSLVYVPEVGIFLNNAMQNFDPRPGLPASIAPGKMPVFAAPALVATKGGKASFAASGSGGYRIETGVLHTFMNRIDHRMTLQDAVDHPRVHCQGSETFVDRRIPEKVQQSLAKAGHDVTMAEERPDRMTFGRVAAVAANPRRGTLTAAAGPSWTTAIAGF
jgi:gamma-glutamyltranspeptidase/glutathione hydrolase